MVCRLVGPRAIVWTNAVILLIRTLKTNFSQILSEIRTFSFNKMHLKMSSAKYRQLCLGLNVFRMLAKRTGVCGVADNPVTSEALYVSFRHFLNASNI